MRVVTRTELLDLARLPAPVDLAPAGEPHDTAIQLFTSGTTGKPKAAILRHEHLMSYILGTIDFGSAAEDDAVLISVPPYHIAGISAVLSSTYAGRRMVSCPTSRRRHGSICAGTSASPMPLSFPPCCPG